MKNDDQKQDSDIFLDPDSGISVDEQKEILAKINGITDSRRRSLSAGTTDVDGKKNGINAKKSGKFFPVLVIAAAVTALVIGIIIIFSFQGRTDIRVRVGTKVYNSAERALINEIRRETSSRLRAKELEISEIIAQLENIDSELRELHSSRQELTVEQQSSENRLRNIQNEYLAALAKLQDERARILEEARIREAELQAQLERRTRELVITEEQSSAAIEQARSELEMFSREQSLAATVEAQVSAFFLNIHTQLRENLLDEAVETIKNTRLFLNTPAFLSLRSIQSRKELYNQTINTFESMVEEALRNRAALEAGILPPDPETERVMTTLQERNTQLEQQLALYTAQGSDAARRLGELERTVASRDGTITELQQQTTLHYSAISELRQETALRDNTITELQQQNSQLDNTITELRQQNENLQGRITAIQQVLE